MLIFFFVNFASNNVADFVNDFTQCILLPGVSLYDYDSPREGVDNILLKRLFILFLESTKHSLLAELRESYKSQRATYVQARFAKPSHVRDIYTIVEFNLV